MLNRYNPKIGDYIWLTVRFGSPDETALVECRGVGQDDSWFTLVGNNRRSVSRNLKRLQHDFVKRASKEDIILAKLGLLK